MSGESQETCGDYGGVTEDGTPCSRPSGWGTNGSTKQCKYHEGELDIGHTRTCDCDNGINCLTAKEWIKDQLGVWEFHYQGEDIRDKEKHPATYPIQLAERCIKLFSHKGELIVDPFVGSGTTLLAARNNGRRSVGFDLNQEYIDLTKSRLQQKSIFSEINEETEWEAICDNAKNIPNYLDDETITAVVTSPPYANLLNRERKNKSRRGDERKNDQYGKVEQYSQDPEDLGTMDLDNYTNTLGDIFEKMRPLFRYKGHLVINVADMWWENTRISIHKHVIDEIEERGFEHRNTIIWDRRDIVNDVGIFGWPSNYITMGTTYEYILHFWRPDEERMEEYESTFGDRARWDTR